MQISGLRGSPVGVDRDEGIREAAQEFEDLLYQQVMKSMRATVGKTGLVDGGFGGEVFEGMLDEEYSKIASRGRGLGLAEVIAEQMGARPRSDAEQMGVRPSAGAGMLNAYGRHQSSRMQIPVEGPISSEFGMRALGEDDDARLHAGLDLAAPPGAPIRAARGGVVTFAGPRGGYGNAVVIEHGAGVETLYGHASKLDVAVGDRVRAGARIARVGSTGRSTGPHLHFEVREHGKPVDPAPLLGMAE